MERGLRPGRYPGYRLIHRRLLDYYQYTAARADTLIARQVRSWDEAQALAGLGRCALAEGHAMQAGVLVRQALEIFQRIGAAEAADLAAELEALAGLQQAGEP
jgi:hypothetical protein